MRGRRQNFLLILLILRGGVLLKIHKKGLTFLKGCAMMYSKHAIVGAQFMAFFCRERRSDGYVI